jgi:hypothetical protein
MLGVDWSRASSINGVETVVSRPFSFPLAIGKTWRIDYTQENPNARLSDQHVSLPYKVVGWEEVTTKAGTFKALKVEANGTWTADVKPIQQTGTVANKNGNAVAMVQQNSIVAATKITGRLYRAYWYVPEKKRWVRSIEETYDGDGTRTQGDETELLSYNSSQN